MTYHAKVIAGGKIVIPAELRREFGIKDGDTVILERKSEGGFSLMTHEQIVRKAQAEIADLSKPYAGSVVDDLVAERRAEAAAEAAAEAEMGEADRRQAAA